MLHEIKVDGVEIIMNDHMNWLTEGRYITRYELKEQYPRYISEMFFDEDRSDEFKAWDELDDRAQWAVFNYIAYEDPDYDWVEKMLPRMLKNPPE